MLRNDLATHPNACTLVYWHNPLIHSTNALSTKNSSVKWFWADAFNGGADLVLGANRHYYERFQTLDVNGAPATTGMREFVVGTGGGLRGEGPTLAPRGGVPNTSNIRGAERWLHPRGLHCAVL